MHKIISNISNTINAADRRLDSVRFMPGSYLKVIAVTAMFTDHLSKIVLQLLLYGYWQPMAESGQMSAETFQSISNFIYFALQGFGTVAFPLFCFLISEGFFYTRSRKRYMGMMLAFAVISEIPFDLGFFSNVTMQSGTFPFYFEYQNVFFTLFLGLAALWCIEYFAYYGKSKSAKIKSVILQVCGVTLMAVLAELIHCDYKSRGVLYIAAFYIFRKNRIYQILLFLLLYTLYTRDMPSAFTFSACLVILLYNGQRGKLKLKYFFYIFYPLHLAVLYIASAVLEWLLI